MELLIIKPSSLGDIVHALIVAQAIKTQRPEARITWVVRQSFSPILESTAIVDEIIAFDRKGGPGEFFRLLKKIRAKKYDVSLDMQGLLRTGLMNAAARAKLKLCRRDQREGAQLFATKIVDFPKNGSRHAVDMLMEFLPPLGLQKIYSPLKLKEAFKKGPGVNPQLTDTPCVIERVGGSASSLVLPSDTILIFPSSRGKWAQKEWPHMRALTEKLLAEGKTVAWCSDEKLDVPSGALDFCQKLMLGELLPFIAQAGLVIGNDAGPTHMAAALGVPTVGLYGPTLPERAGAYPLDSQTNRNLRAPSGKMEDLTVDEVLQAVRGLTR